MAEETEGQDTGAEAVAGGVAGTDPLAAGLALAGAGREKADAFLDEQRALAADQRRLVAEQYHHLRRQFTQLDLNIWQQRLGVLLRIATAFVGLAIAAGLAFMVWDASRSSGLLIEPFSVPPDLAARGMTGQVVASQMLDKLTAMLNASTSVRAAKSYAHNWGNDLRVEIPETGVSMGEVYRFLREWLGHDTHITGEIVRTASGLSLTARAGIEGAESVTGSEADLDGLVQKSAEAIYRLTQPYRYANYLQGHDRQVEAMPIVKALAETGSGEDHFWGSAMWGTWAGEEDGIDTSLRLLQHAVIEEPDNIIAQLWVGWTLSAKSLPEQAIREDEKGLSLLSSNKLEMITPAFIPLRKVLTHIYINQELGDYRKAEQGAKEYLAGGSGVLGPTSGRLAGMEAGMHDLAAARASIVDSANYRVDTNASYTALYILKARMQIDSDAQNWGAVLSDADAFAPLLKKYLGLPSFLPTMTVPLTAYAEARLGKFTDAEAHIAATPADCYDCLIARARIAEFHGQDARSDYWFERAIDGQKSIPFAYAYWGHALMVRGDLHRAVVGFTFANRRGPHFADPLEMWGEALMLQKHPDLALAKFEEAEKYGPNWGRLHLKWGEALASVGRRNESRARYQKAATLNLTAADKAELAKEKP